MLQKSKAKKPSAKKPTKKQSGKQAKQQVKPQAKPQKRKATKKPPKMAERKKAVLSGIKGVHAVKLVKIKNKYMFNPTEKNQKDYKPNGVHTYIVFKDAEEHTHAIRTTHLYEKKKFDQIEKNILMAMKLPGIKYPSGVRYGIISTDIEGKKLDLNKVHAVNINGKRGTYLSKKQAEKVLNFADRKRIKKKKP